MALLYRAKSKDRTGVGPHSPPHHLLNRPPSPSIHIPFLQNTSLSNTTVGPFPPSEQRTPSRSKL
jgi:hypothetical protein